MLWKYMEISYLRFSRQVISMLSQNMNLCRTEIGRTLLKQSTLLIKDYGDRNGKTICDPVQQVWFNWVTWQSEYIHKTRETYTQYEMQLTNQATQTKAQGLNSIQSCPLYYSVNASRISCQFL